MNADFGKLGAESAEYAGKATANAEQTLLITNETAVQRLRRTVYCPNAGDLKGKIYQNQF